MTWHDIAFTGVYWNDADRVDHLLHFVRPWFKEVVVGVQTSPDHTLDVARATADVVVTDECWGHCEPTIGKVLERIRAPWCLLISADEWPEGRLLESLDKLMLEVQRKQEQGAYIRFLSSIEGETYESEQDNHLRFFDPKVGWPATLHSRPMIEATTFWTEGRIRHDRSLDEMVIDYLRYFKIGRGNAGWEAHNRVMLHDAIAATAKVRGWDWIREYPWWPEARAIAFEDRDPF